MGLVLDTSALVALERAEASLEDVLAPLAEEEVAGVGGTFESTKIRAQPR